MDKKSLVIYEQDFTFLEDIKRRFMLEPDYQIVSTVQDPNSLLQEINLKQPNYILISLPINDLTQIVNNIKMSYPKTHIIIAINSIEQLQQFGQLPVTLLNKPYTVESLIDKLKKLDTRNNNNLVNDQFNNIPQSNPNIDQNTNMSANNNSNLASLRNAMSSFNEQQTSNQNYTSQNTFVGGGNTPPSMNDLRNINSQNQNSYSFNQNNDFNQNNNLNQNNDFNQNNNFGQNNNMNFNVNPMQNQTSQFNQFNQTPNNGGGTYRTIKQTILAVNCPKGGVGKTTIAKELATAYSTVRINGQPLKVLLVDCDLDFGDVASMLKMNPYPNIINWLEDIREKLKFNPNIPIKYTQDQIEQYLLQHPTGLKILAAPSSHSDALDITDKEFEIVLSNLKESCNFDIIILDTGNNTKDYTLLSLDKANTILMVTTMDVTTIYDTNMLLNTLRTIQFPVNKIKLVVNKVPHNDRDIDTQEIAQVLRTDIIAQIPEEPKIRQLNNVGTPAVLGKETEYTAAVRRLGQQIVPVFNKQITPSNTNKKQKSSLFAKLFGKK